MLAIGDLAGSVQAACANAQGCGTGNLIESQMELHSRCLGKSDEDERLEGRVEYADYLWSGIDSAGYGPPPWYTTS
ncbi:hypothetical protein N7492_010243 [Penicillium capsulatum]|uniref:Uncharacterized protein n=1 Tax=Penicillium capsulatum TaxID=69766 RepID=A0A9W9HNF6_9EURO|nr:hypothetical protein N7492_010243 [Penicillium capsulatum]KAJ6112750.1 hypothetical protein N7512_008074 [Penicillium capsulatum]